MLRIPERILKIRDESGLGEADVGTDQEIKRKTKLRITCWAHVRGASIDQELLEEEDWLETRT